MRNLFIKSRARHRLRQLLLLSSLAFAVMVWLNMHPRQGKDALLWAPPLEPSGVVVQTQVSPAAAVKPAPVAAVASAPAPASAAVPAAEVERAAVRQAVERWRAAWSGRDVETYLSQYGRSFVPPGGQSRSAWESTRRQRISSKKQIVVEIRELEITLEENAATAKFEQTYAADALRSVGQKTLRLSREGGRWLIVSESAN